MLKLILGSKKILVSYKLDNIKHTYNIGQHFKYGISADISDIEIESDQILTWILSNTCDKDM